MDDSYRDAFTGSTFDDFLLEEGLHEEVESAANPASDRLEK
jgi:hypothetical protein